MQGWIPGRFQTLGLPVGGFDLVSFPPAEGLSVFPFSGSVCEPFFIQSLVFKVGLADGFEVFSRISTRSSIPHFINLSIHSSVDSSFLRHHDDDGESADIPNSEMAEIPRLPPFWRKKSVFLDIIMMMMIWYPPQDDILSKMIQTANSRHGNTHSNE